MKRVRILTGEYAGREAICQIPARGVYWIDFEKKNLTFEVRPEILKDASILDVTRITYLEMSDTFDIRSMTNRVESYMFENKRQPREGTTDRRLRELRQWGHINYEVVDRMKGTYRKLLVCEKTMQGKIKM